LKPFDPSDPRVKRFQGALTIFGAVGGLINNLLILAFVWPDRRMIAATVAYCVINTAFNGWVSARLYRRLKPDPAEIFRAFGNVTMQVVLAQFTGWILPVWLILPFSAAFADGVASRFGGRWRIAIHLVPANAAALLAGQPLSWSLAMTFISVFIYAVFSLSARAIREMLAESEDQRAALEKAHAELKAWNTHAIAQEKLTSIGMLAAGMAHEINNPMSFVTANIEGLIQDLESMPEVPAPLVEYRDEILADTLDGCQRVNSIVADLRRFARGEVQAAELFDVRDEVDAAVRMANGQTGDGQAIRVDLDAVPAVFGSPRQIGQVMLNLLVNGVQALDGPGEVHVTTRHEGDDVAVMIRDTGVGMSQATLDRLFQPFFTTKGSGKGTGLGLAVAHGIVKQHGGCIDVASSPGAGTTFTIRLPIARARV
jgi:two-component system NtrC family sensor kinase